MSQRFAIETSGACSTADLGAGGVAVGKRTLTAGSASRPVQRRVSTVAASPPVGAEDRPAGGAPGGPGADPFWFAGGDANQIAERGVASASAPLPHLGAIQASFGRHDLSGARAAIGGAASEASEQLGADAYATGDRVGFAAAPDLHTAAHEAAHLVQQRGGVQLLGGLGGVDDEHERHADEVAARVVAGASAEELLDRYAGAGEPITGVQRLIRIGKPPKRARDQQARAIEKVLDLLAGPVGSGPLAMLLSYLTRSTRSHLHLEFVDAEEGPTQGDTGIFLGDQRTVDAAMLQEALLLDPTPLLAPDSSLVVSVRIFLRPDTPPHELATTILHELELHVVPAAVLLHRLEFIRTHMGNDPEKILGMLFQYLARADDHRDLQRMVAMVESARQVLDACRETPFDRWARGVLTTVCDDAEEQLLAACLKAPVDRDVQRIEHLQQVTTWARGRGGQPGDVPKELSAPHPYRTVTTGERSLSERQVVEFLLTGVRERRPMEAMVEELGTTFGVPRAESIRLYNREVAPLIFAEAPTYEDFNLLLQFMESYGVPPPVTYDLVDKQGRRRGDMDDEPPSRFKLPPPREPSFATDPDREPDWTPITNNYVPRSVLEGHARLPPRTWILVDGYQMRVHYVDKGSVRGASRVKGSRYGDYMVLRFEVRGG